MLPSVTMRYELRAMSLEQRGQWDEYVAEHPSGHLLQSWAWGDLKASAGWSPVRLVLWDHSSQTIVAAAQVLRRTASSLPLRLGHLAYIPKGPVIDWSQAELCETFFAQLDRYLSKQGAIALRVEPGQALGTPEGDLALKRLASAQRVPAVQPLRTIILDLTPTEEELLASMKEKWRYNIRLAGRKGVQVRIGQSLEDVRAWYNLLQTTGERDKFGIHILDYYQQVWQLFAPRDQVRLLLAEYEGQLLAGIFVSLFARQAIYLYGASSNEQRQRMPNYLLQWEAIRWARQQGAQQYDFWGIPQTDAEEEAMVGVYRFKRGWGGRVVEFPGGYQHTYHPVAMKLASRFIG